MPQAARIKLQQLLEATKQKQRNASREQFKLWFLDQFHTDHTCCSLEDFATYFMNKIRQQLEAFVHNNEVIFLPIDEIRPLRSKNRNQCRKSAATDIIRTATLVEMRLQQNLQTAAAYSTPKQNVNRSATDDNLGRSFDGNASTPQRRNRSDYSNNSRNDRSANLQSSATTGMRLGDFLTETPNRQNRRKSHGYQQQQQHSQQYSQGTATPSVKKRISLTSTPIYNQETGLYDTNHKANLKTITVAEVEYQKTRAGQWWFEDFEEKPRAIVMFPIETATHKEHLDIMAKIYALLMDMNFASSILGDIALLLNLLHENADQLEDFSQHQDALRLKLNSSAIEVSPLGSFINCAYFAIRVLNYQRYVFGLLDLHTLTVVSKCNATANFPEYLKSYLDEVQQHKERYDVKRDEISYKLEPIPCVSYQEEKDSRAHFRNGNEFGAFKEQRDAFCLVFKQWEQSYMEHKEVAAELTVQVREIFSGSKCLVNMAHLVKLFISQLLLSSSRLDATERVMQEISKLKQRVKLPAYLINEQFPHYQQFFRDFINTARSSYFEQQLKLELYSQLIQMNDSSFEHENWLEIDKLDVKMQSVCVDPQNKLSVRAETLLKMLTLSKFLGFVVARPHGGAAMEDVLTVEMEQQQLEMRKLLPPEFNLYKLLEASIKANKVLITVPWLVQYMIMLDPVSLQLDDCAKTLRLMFTLYANLDNSLHLTLNSQFLLRCFMGYLFDLKPRLVEHYYSYRGASNDKELEAICKQTLHATTAKSHKHTDIRQKESMQWNALYESILYMACPFLMRFRQIIGYKPTLTTPGEREQRMSRYRSLNNVSANNTSAALSTQFSTMALTITQSKLLEQLVHSQSPSTQRSINLITEQIYRALVKDIQQEIFVPCKQAANDQINNIAEQEFKTIYNTIVTICNNAQNSAGQQLRLRLPNLLHIRIEKALEALLPRTVAEVIKQNLLLVIRRDVNAKVHEWIDLNVVKQKFFNDNIRLLADKIYLHNQRKKSNVEVKTEVKITESDVSPAEFAGKLEHWLHCTSLRLDLLNVESIIEFLKELPLAFEHVLPTAFYLMMGNGVVQLLKNLIIRLPHLVSPELVSAAIEVWSTNQMRQAMVLPRLSPDATPTENAVAEPQTFCYYDSLLSFQFIRLLAGHANSFQKLKQLLYEIVKNELLTIDYVNCLIVSLFKVDWPLPLLKQISEAILGLSSLLRQLPKNRGDDYENAKALLFMETMADLSDNLRDSY